MTPDQRHVQYVPHADHFEADLLDALEAVPVLAVVPGALGELETMVAYRTAMDRIIRRQVAALRSRSTPVPWSVLGRALGVTAQGAQQRYGLDRLMPGRRPSGQPAAKRRGVSPGRAAGPARSA